MTERQLDHREIINAAGYATGHFSILDDGFGERLGKFTRWLNDHGNLSADQVMTARRQILQVVISRVLLAADRRRILEIAEEKIERPVFVIGYSRTGTTLLHCLLTTDPSSRGPTWLHTHQPSPPPGEQPVAQGRIDAALWDLQSWHEYTPGMMAMHPYWDEGADTLIEDEEIHVIDFQNLYPTLLYKIPALTTMNLGDTADPAGSYAFQKQFMQHLQWNMPKKHWVMKGCAHQFQLKELFDAFPDAICVWPHRNPVEVHKSTLAILSVLYHAITNGNIDWKEFARDYLQATRAGIDRVLADPLVDDPRIIHVRFKDVAKDPVAAVKGIYEKCGLPYSNAFDRAMRAWLDDPGHRPDRYGRYPYSFEPFGVSADEVASLFADYSKRFGLD